jgi:hypothetical protein
MRRQFITNLIRRGKIVAKADFNTKKLLKRAGEHNTIMAYALREHLKRVIEQAKEGSEEDVTEEKEEAPND